MSRDIDRMHNDYLDPDRAGLNDVIPDNQLIEGAFSKEYDSLYDLYRSVYRYTACGAGMGALISGTRTQTVSDGPCAGEVYDEEFSDWYYCDDLHQLGDWKSLRESGLLVMALSVSSIVEGVDQTTDTHIVSWDFEDGTIFLGHDFPFDRKTDEFHTDDDSSDPSVTLYKAFYNALDQVEEEATAIWNETHGCERCAKHWHKLGIKTDEWGGSFEGCDGLTVVWDKCPSCKGHGEVI